MSERRKGKNKKVRNVKRIQELLLSEKKVALSYKATLTQYTKWRHGNSTDKSNETIY